MGQAEAAMMPATTKENSSATEEQRASAAWSMVGRPAM